MRNTIILIILAFMVGQLMSFNATNVKNDEDLLRAEKEKDTDWERSVKYKSEEKTEQGTILRATLDNGLEVVIQELENTEVASVHAYVKVGSIYEGENLGSGISHYCEHIVASGSTNKRTEEESSELLRSIGGYSNASTYLQYTTYYITTLNDYSETAIDLIGDWLSNSDIKESVFNREKGVIITEVDKGETEPARVFSKFAMSKMFGKTPLAVPIIGYPALVKEVTREKMMAFYNKFYCPNNTVLSIAGGVDAKETLKQVCKYWSSWKRKPLEMPVIPEVKGQTVSRQSCLSTKLLNDDIARMQVMYHTVPAQNKDVFALEVLSDLLTGSENSRLIKLLRDEKHLVNSVNSGSWTPGFGSGEFAILVYTTYDKLLETRDAIFDELEELSTMNVQNEELVRAKKVVRGYYIKKMQGADAFAKGNALNVINNVSTDYIDRYLEEIDKVTADEIRAVVNKYLVKRRSNVFAFYSQDAADKDEDKSPFVKPEKTGKSDDLIKDASSEYITLENGMRVILKQTPGTKNVAVAGYTHGGTRYENADNSGIFNILAMLMERGSDNYDFDKTSKIFSDLGGAFDLVSGANDIGIEAEFVTGEGHITKAFSLINDILRNPKFDEDELTQIKRKMAYSIKSKDESWYYEAFWLLMKKFFDEHPYSKYTFGTPESLQKITLSQVKELHSKYITPNNFVLAVVGDFDLSNTSRIIRGIFSSWKKSDTKIDEGKTFKLRTTVNEFVKKSPKKQVTICIGYNGSKYINREDVLKLKLIDAVTSGIYLPSGWLHDALRGGDNNYVYFVHASTYFFLDAGLFYVMTQCSVEDKDKVIEIIREQMKRTWTELISEKELDFAKRIYKTTEAINNESSSRKAMEYAHNELYGIGWNNEQSDFDIVDKITSEDLKKTAEKYLKDNEMLIVIEPEKDK